MSVRVVARVRPLLKNEVSKDVIVQVASGPADSTDDKTIIRIPNPKNEAELYTFQFNRVYDQDATQSQLFDAEGGSPKQSARTWLIEVQSRRPSSISSKAAMSPCSRTESQAPGRHIPCEVESH